MATEKVKLVRRAARLTVVPVLVGLTTACGAVHNLPAVSRNELSMAQAEIQTRQQPERKAVDDAETRAMMQSVLHRLRPAADQLCREVNVGNCNWDFRLSSSGAMNASSSLRGTIVIHRGIFEFADNEEEIAMVVAHEIAHQVGDHMGRNVRSQMAGRLAGAIILGALGAAVSAGNRNSAIVTSTAMDAGANLGGAIGGIAVSKEQEREADYMSAVILYRSGVDLDKARGFLVKLAKRSGRTETGLLDTHPAGPERIASWDRAVQEIKASNGQLPKRQ